MNSTDYNFFTDKHDEDDEDDIIVTGVSSQNAEQRKSPIRDSDSKDTKDFQKMAGKCSYSELSDSDEDGQQYEMLSLKERLMKNIHNKQQNDHQSSHSSKLSLCTESQSSEYRGSSPIHCEKSSPSNSGTSSVILLDDEKCSSVKYGDCSDTNSRKSSSIVIEEDSNDNYYDDIYESHFCYMESKTSSACSSQSSVSVASTDQRLDLNFINAKVGDVNSNARKKRTPEEIAESKLQAKQRKLEKEAAREVKEREKKRQAQIRVAEKERKKQFGSAKDCLQYLKVVFDNHVVNNCGLGAALFRVCDNLGVQCATESQMIPFSITWRRTITELSMDTLEVETIKREKTEEDIVVLVPIADFIQMVHTHKQEQQGQYCGTDKTLMSFVQTLKGHLHGMIITLVVMGMEKYFRDQKTQHNRQHKEAVLSAQHGGTQKQKKASSATYVSRIDVEEAVTKTQLLTDIIVHTLETGDDVAELIRTYTKAVAEKPSKCGRLQSIFSFHEDGTTGVKVDRSGHGLLKVWKQQLLQFNNISPDIAEAIISEYPSPRLLLKAYNRCGSQKESERLLENIVVRRGAGVLETTRRVGKEMSRRFYIFMMSHNPNEIIK